MDNQILQNILNDVNSMVSHYDLSDNLRAALVQVILDEYKACRYFDSRFVNINGKEMISVEDLEKPRELFVTVNNIRIPWEFPPEMD